MSARFCGASCAADASRPTSTPRSTASWRSPRRGFGSELREPTPLTNEDAMTAPIETYAIPYHLYRYRSLRRIGKKDSDVLDREMQAIEQNRLWCSDFDSMNDPMEGAFEPSAMVERSRDYAEAAQMIRDGKLNKGMCAFSEARNIELMWAHYADEFRGICISYMFELLRDGLPKRISSLRISYSEFASTGRANERSRREYLSYPFY